MDSRLQVYLTVPSRFKKVQLHRRLVQCFGWRPRVANEGHVTWRKAELQFKSFSSRLGRRVVHVRAQNQPSTIPAPMSKCAASLSRSTRVSVARCSVFRRPCPIKTTCRYQALNVTFTPCWQRINNAIAATVEPYSSRHYSVQTKLPRTRTAHKLSQAKANGQPRRDPTSLTAGKRRIDTSLQLLHLKDPFKLAVHVKSILNKDQFVKAQALVHAASKGSSSYTVSWNHLINFQMRQGKVEAAMKTYNDVSPFPITAKDTLSDCPLYR